MVVGIMCPGQNFQATLFTDTFHTAINITMENPKQLIK